MAQSNLEKEPFSVEDEPSFLNSVTPLSMTAQQYLKDKQPN